MTYAPATWKEAQQYLHEVTGLPYDALGMVHSSPQGGGYHEGIDLLKQAGRYLNQANPDYSVRESTRDQPGTDGSSALDFGEFDITVNGVRIRLVEDFNPWLVAQCSAGAIDTLWIREVIYTPDHKTVKRWDRQGIRSTGDNSHLTHTHISGYRDEENTPKKPLFKRFFAEKTGKDADMPLTPEEWRNIRNPNEILWQIINGEPVVHSVQLPENKFVDVENRPQTQLNRIETKVNALAAQPPSTVTLSAEDRAAIATLLAADLRTIVREEIAARFADAGDVVGNGFVEGQE